MTSGDSLDWILVAATQAINSTTATKGRSPYQAVFGKGDLFSDERATAVHGNHLLGEELRCQALKIIAEMRASSVICRALLRKTRPSLDEAKNILPGTLAAFSRWTRKAQGRKKGGYVLGRLLHHDPDGKGAFLHTGTSTARVTYKQMRPACRLEGWAPSMEDIKVLKNGWARTKKMRSAEPDVMGMEDTLLDES